jgi:uncharacterized ferritin-like protein (DUF455 family)
VTNKNAKIVISLAIKNADKNYNDVPSHSSAWQSLRTQKRQMLVRMSERKEPSNITGFVPI